MEQVSQLIVSGQEKMLATVQNMIDKSLGKQLLTDDSGRSNVDRTFQQNTMPLESSAAHAPHYGMPMNFYNGQRSPEQCRAHGAVRPVSLTGHGGPVPTGQIGFGALVAYLASPELIASVPHVLADFN